MPVSVYCNAPLIDPEMQLFDLITPLYFYASTKLVIDMEKMGLAIFALVAAIGLVTVAAVTALDTPMTINEVQGHKSTVGQCASFLKNASAQICHNLR